MINLYTSTCKNEKALTFRRSVYRCKGGSNLKGEKINKKRGGESALLRHLYIVEISSMFVVAKGCIRGLHCGVHAGGEK